MSNRIARLMVARILRSGGAVVAPTAYASALVDTYGASEVWPLVDIASGTAIPAYVSSARNGVLSGWTLQNSAGPVADSLAPTSDGVNDYGNVYSTDLRDNFGYNVGSVLIWGYLNSAFDSTDILLYLANNDSNRVWFEAISASGLFGFGRTAAAATKQVTTAGGTDGWHSWGLSWSTTADELKGYYDGAQVGATQTGLATWNSGAAPLSASRTCIGAYSTTGQLPWLGGLAYLALRWGGVWSDADFAGMHAAAATSLPD